MLVLLIFAFIAGIVTVLSPCILPILPLILSSSVKTEKGRSLGIVLGFITSFTFFTLFLSTLVRVLDIDPSILRTVAMVMIAILGLSLLLPNLQLQIEQFVARHLSFAARFQQTQSKKKGLLGGFLVGISLGLLWTPCVGPILAAVITLAASSSVTLGSVLITLAYSLGTAIPMFAIIYSGQRLLSAVPWLAQRATRIQQVFGVVMILLAVALFFNYDRQFQTWVLTKYPQYGAGLTAIEDNQAVETALNRLSGRSDQPNVPTATLFSPTTKAPEFTGATGWLQSDPLTLAGDLRGKVVLVDFWTYSCINCIRTFPYLTEWYDKYKDQGFVIVGVHSPEFEFEKSAENVTQAANDFGLTYPIVQDNNFDIWQAYENRYWPAHYLIDKEGYIRYTHFGEGKYQETENAIRELLGEQPLLGDEVSSPAGSSRNTPETYLGWSRAEAYSLSTRIRANESSTFTLSEDLEPNAVGLGGTWFSHAEHARAEGDTPTLRLDFTARDVYLVMEPGTETGEVEVLLDGQPLPAELQTADSAGGTITIDKPRKYDVVTLPENGRHVLELRFSGGVKAFAFTFG
ncbi:MAG: cytochrome c biogenesis protein DipZ [bacterium]|nr:cytochrome c biogenesis protein DipZ [bacterium]